MLNNGAAVSHWWRTDDIPLTTDCRALYALPAALLLATAALAGCAAPPAAWQPSWGTALVAPNDKLALAPAGRVDVTLRQAMRPGLGDLAGTAPVALTFAGAAGITVAPGAESVRDPLAFPVMAGGHSRDGHIVVRVPPGGTQFYIAGLENRDETDRVESVTPLFTA